MRRLLFPAFVIATAAVLGVAAAHAHTTDDTVLNQTVVQDAIGDSGNGADLASLTVTTYADGTISFTGTLANRSSLGPTDTVQLFVDLNDDGKTDLNVSLWPDGFPSHLGRWTGSEWASIRQLPELVQGEGRFSIRLPLSVYRDAANVPVGDGIGFAATSATFDRQTGKIVGRTDSLPDGSSFMRHLVRKPAAPPPAPTTAPPTTTSAGTVKRVPAPTLSVSCGARTLWATVTPAGGPKITVVVFSANGVRKVRVTKAPWVAAIAAKGLHGRITIRAAVTAGGATRTLSAAC